VKDGEQIAIALVIQEGFHEEHGWEAYIEYAKR
jgi:hypothetical protein